ncbi:FGGY family carbohydrate kinase [Leifsonia sp. Root227]|uniref:FGGY family carbohydrate kinase n=1 Tax=Leifsonia sp. Root227 TaxID=1736496 RepID=UPI0009E81C5B|nr:FGGY family carbohydrate kinase [Leifsonia sp. Root227]
MARPLLVAGVDSSTQNSKLVVVDASDGTVVRTSTAPHPDGTQIHPEHWWRAFIAAGAPTADVAALSVTAQQHSAIFLDEAGAAVRDAILWNDLTSSESGRALQREWGVERWVDEIGLLPAGAHPVSKLRWIRDHEPENAARVSRVMVPHDWLTWRMLRCPEEATTDRSDASGTGYLSIEAGAYRMDVMKLAFGRTLEVPRVLHPSARAGITASGIVLGAGCGDNPATALGLMAVPGEIIVSIGTSMTATTVLDAPVRDPLGVVDSMADATGRFLPIVASLNGARVLLSTAALLGVGLEELDHLAASGTQDADDLVFLPFLDGERNPHYSDSQGALLGLTRTSMKRENIARAAVLGIAAAAATSIGHLQRIGVRAERIVVVGGGARSDSLAQALADLTQIIVDRPPRGEYAALGAARQALWALSGDLPAWNRGLASRSVPQPHAPWMTRVRERHYELGERLFAPPLTDG